MIHRAAPALLLVSLALAGCKDDHAPRWREVCTRSHIETSTVLMFGGMGAAYGGVPIGSGMHMVQQNNTVCDASEVRCDFGGKDYLGPRVCPAREP